MPTPERDTWLPCQVCAAPAETRGEPFSMKGVGRKDQDIIVYFQRYLCVAGHHYQLEILEEDAE